MQTDFCKQLGVELPIFAFTHCRDVVVAVSKAGGIGVLGAVGFSPEQLKEAMERAKGRRLLFVDTCHAGNAYNVRLEKDSVDAHIAVISATGSSAWPGPPSPSRSAPSSASSAC